MTIQRRLEDTGGGVVLPLIVAKTIFGLDIVVRISPDCSCIFTNEDGYTVRSFEEYDKHMETEFGQCGGGEKVIYNGEEFDYDLLDNKSMDLIRDLTIVSMF